MSGRQPQAAEATGDEPQGQPSRGRSRTRSAPRTVRERTSGPPGPGRTRRRAGPLQPRLRRALTDVETHWTCPARRRLGSAASGGKRTGTERRGRSRTAMGLSRTLLEQRSGTTTSSPLFNPFTVSGFLSFGLLAVVGRFATCFRPFLSFRRSRVQNLRRLFRSWTFLSSRTSVRRCRSRRTGTRL